MKFGTTHPMQLGPYTVGKEPYTNIAPYRVHYYYCEHVSGHSIKIVGTTRETSNVSILLNVDEYLKLMSSTLDDEETKKVITYVSAALPVNTLPLDE